MTYSKKFIHNKPLIVGYVATNQLLLDLDGTTLEKVRLLLKLIFASFPEVGDALIMLSSSNNGKDFYYVNNQGIPKYYPPRNGYHVIFNNRLERPLLIRVIQTLVGLNAIQPQILDMLTYRGDLTLRVTGKPLSIGYTRVPLTVEYIYNDYSSRQDNLIQDYKDFYKLILGSLFPLKDPEAIPNNSGYTADDSTEDNAINPFVNS